MDRNGYIGRAPADSSVVVARQVFSPPGVTTDFTFTAGYDPGYLDLYLNGIRLIEGTDYVATSSPTITVLNGGSTGGDVLEAVAYKAFNATTSNRIGVTSAGSLIGNVDTLNFIGVGNTFLLNGTQVDISISGSAGAGGTWANYDGVNGITTSKKVRIQNNLDVTGNISVGGTLTYEDVTNVDSVGVITARSGIHVTGGNVGVGTAIPAHKLDVISTGVVANVKSTNNNYALQFAGNNCAYDVYVGSDNSNNFLLANENNDGTFTERLRIDAGGKVGIGTNVPITTAALSVSGTDSLGSVGRVAIKRNDAAPSGSGALGAVVFSDKGTTIAAEIRARRNSGTWTSGSSQPTMITFHTTLDGANSVTERFRIASTGAIGLSGANYGNAGQVLTSQGLGACTWEDAGGGISTEAFAVGVGTVITLDLTAAQDHKVTATGITTITCTGGAEGVSHDIRIINSGSATVGFSTYFLFPSGAAPTMPSTDGAISMISFTVNRVGTAGTQLLSGASVNYS